jgi:hypothetical protein
MYDFPLTLPPCRVYSLFVNAKSLAGFDSLLHKRIPPLSGFFVSGIYCPFCFFWVGILGSLRARWSCVQSVNPIYPPSRVSHGWRFSRTVNKGA